MHRESRFGTRIKKPFINIREGFFISLTAVNISENGMTDRPTTRLEPTPPQRKRRCFGIVDRGH
jgi:hypothetical protein